MIFAFATKPNCIPRGPVASGTVRTEIYFARSIRSKDTVAEWLSELPANSLVIGM